MPKFFQSAQHLSSLSGSVFTKFKKELQEMTQQNGEIFPFHIGDTFLQPSVQMEHISIDKYPDAHYYTKPQGYPKLIDMLAEQYNYHPDQILIASGATGALHVLAQTMLELDEEVLVLAPYWPLIEGIIKCARAKPISVPFFSSDLHSKIPVSHIEEYLAQFCTEKTVALYINSPNNPTSVALDKEELEALVRFARKHDLAIWSDEVYADLCYTKEHIPVRLLAPERTYAVHSFSKVYGMTGNRCGFILCPSAQTRLMLEKVTTYSYYSVGTASQIAASLVLAEGKSWLEQARAHYIHAGELVSNILQVPKPDGGTFLFLNIEKTLQEQDINVDQFLRKCLQHNIILAPGTSFGEGYDNYVRICFTAAPLDKVLRGVHVLRGLCG